MTVIAETFSPRYEQTRGDLVTIDVSGLGRLLGPPAAIGAELAREASARGVRVQIALAATQTTAMVVALSCPGVTVVGAGEEAAALAPLPLTLLEKAPAAMPAGASAERAAHARHQRAGVGPREKVKNAGIPSAISAMKSWGLRTLGELAALPPGDLAARLGRQALMWQAIARGDDIRPLVPALPEERFDATLQIDWPIEGLEPLSFVLTRLLEPLSTKLERRDRGATVLHVVLRLVTREIHARRLQLPAPLRDARTLRTLALLDLESHPPAAAIDRVTVVIDPTPGRVLQHTLFTRVHPTPEHLSTLLARLGALIGQDRIGAAVPVDSYRPGAFAMKPFATDFSLSRVGPHPHALERLRPPSASSVDSRPRVSGDPAASSVQPRASSLESPASALRRCRQPIPARVAVDGNRPVRVTTDRRGFAGGSVISCAGPWRTSGHWWAGGSACGHASTRARERDACEASASGGGAPRALGSACGPREAPEGSEAEPSRRARASGGGAPRALNDAARASGAGVGPRASEERWNRDEWDVSLSDGGIYRIFRDRETDGWFIDGIVD